MRAGLLTVVVGSLLFTTACDESSPIAPTVPLNQQFTLAPGESRSIESTSIRVLFVRVEGDSRCPADALCVQGGDALVQIRVNSSEYDLHTGDLSQAAVTHGEFRIELVQLQPYPFSSRTIAPGDYRATLTVSR